MPYTPVPFSHWKHSAGPELTAKMSGFAGVSDDYMTNEINRDIIETRQESYSSPYLQIREPTAGDLLFLRSKYPGRYGGCVDREDNDSIYIGGSCTGLNPAVTGLVTKLDRSGMKLWHYHPASYTGQIKARRVVSRFGIGCVVCTNYYSGFPTVYALDEDGNVDWSKLVQAADVNSVAVDQSGNVYIGSLNTSGDNLFKYNSAGVLQWWVECSLGSGYAIPLVIKVGSDGHLYVAQTRLSDS